jgi:hypothetical protein
VNYANRKAASASPLASSTRYGRTNSDSGFSIRKLQKILEATVEARNATAVRH